MRRRQRKAEASGPGCGGPGQLPDGSCQGPLASSQIYTPRYYELRGEVLARNNGLCVECGAAKAVECHHAMPAYPCGEHVRPDQLVGLCEACHALCTSIRKFQWRFGADRHGEVAKQVVWLLHDHMRTAEFEAEFRAVMAERGARRHALAPTVEQAQREMVTAERAPVAPPASSDAPAREMRVAERPKVSVAMVPQAPQREMEPSRWLD